MLHPVHRGIGLAQEALDVLGVDRPDGSADARLHPQPVPVDHERGIKRRPQALGDRAQLRLVVDRLDDRRELIATEPRDDVIGARAVVQALRDRAQQTIYTRETQVDVRTRNGTLAARERWTFV